MDVTFLTLFVILGVVFKETIGFTAIYNFTAEDYSQYFTSPNYPNNYPDNLNILYTIRAFDPTYQIAIRFESFDLEGSIDCVSDFVKTYDGFVGFGSFQGSYCNYNRPGDWFTSGSECSLVFTTDYSVRRDGFSIQYYATTVNPFNTGMSTTIIIIIVVCCVVGGIIAFITCAVCIYFCNQQAKRKQGRVSHQPGPVFIHSPPQAVQPYQGIAMTPMSATHTHPPTYDTVDYKGVVPPPFNYIPPDSAKPYSDQIFA